MKRKLFIVSRHYQTALRRHLRHGRQTGLASARRLGSQALQAGLQPLDLARLHEETLINELLPGCSPAGRDAMIRQSGIFFAAAILPVKRTHRNATEGTADPRKVLETLSQRTVQLAASNLKLRREIVHRKAVEKELKKSERHFSKSLKESDRLQKQLRRLNREMLSALEDDRKRISRELHDVIAQSLTGINVRLAALKRGAALNTKGLDRKIASTQRLVRESVDIVHRFARELRPAVLDDLGLIPALHSFMKGFIARTGVRARLTAFSKVEQMDTARRTVLYRVAQEALTNVARHAKASRVDVCIQKRPDGICMTIADDGKSFEVDRVAKARNGNHLGLLGMRERMEMIGGRLEITSAPGKGTTVAAHIPARRTPRGGGKCSPLKPTGKRHETNHRITG